LVRGEVWNFNSRLPPSFIMRLDKPVRLKLFS
jgi:hypothetical protein